MQEMVVLLKETNTLQIPILEIKNAVEEMQTNVEKSKGIMQDIFTTIEGTLHYRTRDICPWTDRYNTKAVDELTF